MSYFLRVQYPNKIALEADYHQRLTGRFVITDKSTGQAMAVHQAFVRLTNVKTKQDVIYIAEEDSTGAYKFDLVSSLIFSWRFWSMYYYIECTFTTEKNVFMHSYWFPKNILCM